MKPFELKGHWWVADSPERRRAGVLRSNEEGELRLEVFGRISSAAEAWSRPGSLSLIHGEVFSSPFAVTLQNCFVSRSSFSSGSSEGTEEIYAHRCYLGGHLVADDHFRFTSIRLKTSGLTAWADALSGFRNDDHKSFAYAWEMPEPLRGEFDSGAFQLRTGGRASDKVHQHSIEEYTFLALDFAKAIDIRVIGDDYAYAVQNLVTFATDTPNALTEFSVSQSDTGEGRITIHAPPTFADDTAGADRPPHEMLFSLSAVEGRLPEIFRLWLDLTNQRRTALNIYFSNLYSPAPYSDLRLEVLLHAISLYHAASSSDGGSGAPSDDLLSRLLQTARPEDAPALRELFATHPVVSADRALSAIIWENRDTLSAFPEQDGVAAWDGGKSRIVSALAYIRGRDPGDRAAPTGQEFNTLAEQAGLLFKIALLRDLGFAPPEVLECIKKGQRHLLAVKSLRE